MSGRVPAPPAAADPKRRRRERLLSTHPNSARVNRLPAAEQARRLQDYLATVTTAAARPEHPPPPPPAAAVPPSYVVCGHAGCLAPAWPTTTGDVSRCVVHQTDLGVPAPKGVPRVCGADGCLAALEPGRRSRGCYRHSAGEHQCAHPDGCELRRMPASRVCYFHCPHWGSANRAAHLMPGTDLAAVHARPPPVLSRTYRTCLEKGCAADAVEGGDMCPAHDGVPASLCVVEFANGLRALVSVRRSDATNFDQERASGFPGLCRKYAMSPPARVVLARRGQVMPSMLLEFSPAEGRV
jgi:hypothetical protein